MDLELYLFFLVTTVMLIMVPGPAAITVISQAGTGRRTKAASSAPKSVNVMAPSASTTY